MDTAAILAFLQAQLSQATSRADLRMKVGEVLNSLNSFAAALDVQLSQAPTLFAAQAPGYTAFVEALPIPPLDVLVDTLTPPVAANSTPVANAGTNQSVAVGVVVTLDGSASSDADGDTLTYAWSFASVPSGSAAALSDATSAKPTFTADVAGTYVAMLVVSDGKVASSAATITITAPPAVPPTEP